MKRTAGPVTAKKADGSVEIREAYSPSRLKAIIGHEKATEERKFVEFAPRQARREVEAAWRCSVNLD